MLLWVIGNGFDLQHKIPSSYEDFKRWLHRKNGLSECGSNHSYCSISAAELGPQILPDGGEVYSEISVAEFLCRVISATDSSTELWSNLESNLGRVDFDEIFDDFDSTDREGDPDFWHIVGAIEDHSASIERALLQIRPLFREWVRSELSHHPVEAQPDFSRLFSITPRKFLTFNYTRTLENTYGIDDADVIHIHGCENDDASAFRFGHGSPKKDQDHDYGYGAGTELAYRFHEASRKELNCEALDTIEFEDISAVIFYGFGCGDVDKPYICEIQKRCLPRTPWIEIKPRNKMKPNTDNNSQCLYLEPKLTAALESSKYLGETLDSREHNFQLTRSQKLPVNGATLNLYRTTMGFELKDFASRHGVDRRTVQRWENGSYDIPADVQDAVARQWQAWLDDISTAVRQLESVTLADCSASTLKAWRGDSRHAAKNRAIATALALSGRPVTAAWANYSDS